MTTRTAYLTALRDAIDKARAIADELPDMDSGWGGGFSLFEAIEAGAPFGYCNTSDLLSDLASEIDAALAKGNA